MYKQIQISRISEFVPPTNDSVKMTDTAEKVVQDAKYKCLFCNKFFSNNIKLDKHDQDFHFKDGRYQCPHEGCDDSFHCGSHFLFLNHLKRHFVGEKSVQCPDCGELFYIDYDLKLHIKKRHNQNYLCSYCDFKTYKKDNLTRHLRTHTGEKIVKPDSALVFMCNYCPFKTDQKRTLNRHLVKHSSERTFMCPLCDRSYKYKKDLKKHVMERHPEFDISQLHMPEVNYLENPFVPFIPKPLEFQCNLCDYQSDRKSKFDRHFLTHSEGKHFTCSVCGKAYRDQSSLKSHLKSHNNETEFFCSFCETLFESKENLQFHKAEFHPSERDEVSVDAEGNMIKPSLSQKVYYKKFQCHICSFQTDRRNKLDIHIQTHSEHKEFRCELCEKEFKTLSGLTNHLRSHEKDDQALVKNILQDLKTLQCPLCEKSYKYKKDIIKHIGDYHSNVNIDELQLPETPLAQALIRANNFLCNICAYSTDKKSSYDRHLLTHLEGKHFTCSVCGKGYRDKSNWKTHMRSHNNDHEFFCADCETMFTSRKDLDDHRNAHHHHTLETVDETPSKKRKVESKSKLEEQCEQQEGNNVYSDDESGHYNFYPDNDCGDDNVSAEFEQEQLDIDKIRECGASYEIVFKGDQDKEQDSVKSELKPKIDYSYIPAKIEYIKEEIDDNVLDTNIDHEDEDGLDNSENFEDDLLESDVKGESLKHEGIKQELENKNENAKNEADAVAVQISFMKAKEEKPKKDKKKNEEKTTVRNKIDPIDKTCKCPACDKSYKFINDLRKHVKKKHPDQATQLLKRKAMTSGEEGFKGPRMNCPTCDLDISVLAYQRKHKYICSNTELELPEHMKPTKCDECNKTIKGGKRGMRNHLYSAHGHKVKVSPSLTTKYASSNPRKLCPTCGLEFSAKHYRLKHYYTCNNLPTPDHLLPVPCPDCAKICEGQLALRNHQKSVHGFYPGPCHDCGKVFKSLYTLKVHQKNIHGADADDEEKLCDKCDYKTNSKAKLHVHIKNVHTEAKACTICGSHVKNMDAHMKAKHGEGGVEMASCDVCGKEMTKTSLWLHKKTIHSGAVFSCPHCNYSSSRKDNLKQHMNKWCKFKISY